MGKSRKRMSAVPMSCVMYTLVPSDRNNSFWSSPSSVRSAHTLLSSFLKKRPFASPSSTFAFPSR